MAKVDVFEMIGYWDPSSCYGCGKECSHRRSHYEYQRELYGAVCSRAGTGLLFRRKYLPHLQHRKCQSGVLRVQKRIKIPGLFLYRKGRGFSTKFRTGSKPVGHGFPWTERESKKKASAFYRSGSQTGIHLLLEDSEYNDAGQHRNSDGSKHCRVVKTELAGEIAQGQGQGPVVCGAGE